MSEFLIKTIDDKTLLRSYFAQNKGLYGYALGDLVDPMWSISTFTGAFDGDNLTAVSLVWAGVQPPVYLAFGDPDGAAVLFDSGPSNNFFMLPASLMPTFERYFAISEYIHLWRMAVTAAQFSPSAKPVEGLRRLDGNDLTQLRTLYQKGSGGPRPEEIAAFTAEQLDRDIFWGVVAPDQSLQAVAGTHIVASDEGIGAVGYVFTAEAARGQGYAQATTSAVTQSLFEAGVDTVILNVAQANHSAIRAYTRLGYTQVSHVVEGPAHKIN